MTWVMSGGLITLSTVLLWVGIAAAFYIAVRYLKEHKREMQNQQEAFRSLVAQSEEQLKQLSEKAQVVEKAQLERLFDDIDYDELTQNIMDFDALVFDSIRSVTTVYLSFPVYKISYEERPHVIVKSRQSTFCLDLLEGPLNNMWVETLISISRVSYLTMKAGQKDMLENFLFKKLPFEYAYIALNMAEFFELTEGKDGENIVDLLNTFFTDEQLYVAA